MSSNFLHGIEVIAKGEGQQSIQTVRSAVIGLVGTAPIVDENEPNIHQPVLVKNEKDAVKYFGPLREGYTIPCALHAIFSQGPATILVVNVFDPQDHSTVTDVTAGDIIGETIAQGGAKGLKIFESVGSVFGFAPKILIAPEFSHMTGVGIALESLAQKIHGIACIDFQKGLTFEEVLQSRGPQGDMNIYSDRIVICYPYVQYFNPQENCKALAPLSQYLAGVIARTDHKKGYWVSPSNQVIQGIVGVERALSAELSSPNSEVNMLNHAGIVTVLNMFGTGLRTWGNRSSIYPQLSVPKSFIAVKRVADILHQSVEESMMSFIDRPVSMGLVDTICEQVNSFMRSLKAKGALMEGQCIFHADKNTASVIASGQLIFDISFIPPTPAERITFESILDTSLMPLNQERNII